MNTALEVQPHWCRVQGQDVKEAQLLGVLPVPLPPAIAAAAPLLPWLSSSPRHPSALKAALPTAPERE